MLSALTLALALQAQAPLDAEHLQQAMVAAAESKNAASLAGQRFRVVIPFTDERVRKYRALKQSARWSYEKGTLTTSVGLGQVTEENFKEFKDRNLDKLPPLQSLFFAVDNRSRQSPFSRFSRDGSQGMGFDQGTLNNASSFGLAIPYEEGKVSALPEGFAPLVASHLKGPKDRAETLAKEMTVVFEGEITALGQQPEVFCGKYGGQMMSQTFMGDDRLSVVDRQCFVTARIDKVEIRRRNAVLNSWPKAPKDAD
jgi:hypothetical protein